MNPERYIADTRFLSTEKGIQQPLKIQIEHPTLTPEKGWGCSIKFDGLSVGSDFRIYGDSSLQALALSIKFCVSLLTKLMDAGSLQLAYSDGTACTSEDLKVQFGFLE